MEPVFSTKNYCGKCFFKKKQIYVVLFKYTTINQTWQGSL